MKYLVSGIVLILIIVLPAGSYYYLKSGFDFRKASLAEVSPKANLKDHGTDMSLFLGHTTLLAVADEGNIDRLLKDLIRINEQFDDALTFRTAVIVDSMLRHRFVDTEFQLFPQSVLSSNLTSEKMDQMLIDTSGQVRQFYNSNNYDINQLVEHIAIVLPRVREKDIIERKHEAQ